MTEIDLLSNKLDKIKINEKTPHEILIDIIKIQKIKEIKNDIWNNSPYKDLIKLQINNVGIVGEQFIQNICKIANIESNIDGTKTKKIGGGCGDGIIIVKSIEIKLAHQGCKNNNFQHELGEIPWKTDYMIFIDITPTHIYLTIFKNFTENDYKNKIKCIPYFPTKSITWRKNKGSFKLDTNIKLNENNIINNYTLKINKSTIIDDIKLFILNLIK